MDNDHCFVVESPAVPLPRVRGAAHLRAGHNDAQVRPLRRDQHHCGPARAPIEEQDFLAALERPGSRAHETDGNIDGPLHQLRRRDGYEAGHHRRQVPLLRHAHRCATRSARRLIKPKSLLPFAIKQDVAFESFRAWLASRWFAPNSLTTQLASRLDQRRLLSRLDVRLPDRHLLHRRARRPLLDDRVLYNDRKRQDRVTRSRQVQTHALERTRAAVCRTRSTTSSCPPITEPPPKLVNELTPWDLPALVPFDEAYLWPASSPSRIKSISRSALMLQKKSWTAPIRQTICNDIGGDEQRIS